MNSKITHIKNLVHFAYIDNELHEKEKEFIKKVGERLGLDEKLVDEQIQKNSSSTPLLPTNEILRFILLDDIFNLIVIDNVIADEEISECKKIAKNFGFEEEIVDSFIAKLQKHIIHGFVDNKTDLFIKNELFKLTSKNYTDEKYN